MSAGFNEAALDFEPRRLNRRPMWPFLVLLLLHLDILMISIIISDIVICTSGGNICEKSCDVYEKQSWLQLSQPDGPDLTSLTATTQMPSPCRSSRSPIHLQTMVVACSGNLRARRSRSADLKSSSSVVADSTPDQALLAPFARSWQRWRNCNEGGVATLYIN